MAASERSGSRSRSTARNSPNAGSRSASSNGRSASSIHKSPAVAVRDSPPLTSSLHSRNSASTEKETAYLRKVFLLRCARLASTVLILGFGVGIIACQGDVLRRYNATHPYGTISIPLWPVDLEVRPTWIQILAAVVPIILSLGYLVFALMPSPHSRTTILNYLFTAVSGLSLIFTLFAVIYSPILIRSIFSPFAHPNASVNDSRHTIQTWTCSLYNNVNIFNRDALKLQLPDLSADGALVSAPTGFRRMCTESRVGYGLTVGLCILEFLATSIGLIGLGLEKRIAKFRRSRFANNSYEKA